MKIAVVGVCAAGKTTLSKGLKELGYDAYTVPQEHSGVKTFWRKKSPDILIMLEASLSVIQSRRSVPYGEERMRVQHERLADAMTHADLILDTDPLSVGEVRAQVVSFIDTFRLKRI
jgi:deoxyadenosine/deoxycytidine kinase